MAAFELNKKKKMILFSYCSSCDNNCSLVRKESTTLVALDNRIVVLSENKGSTYYLSIILITEAVNSIISTIACCRNCQTNK